MAPTSNSGVPSAQDLVDLARRVSPPWFSFFVGLQNRTGGETPSPDPLLNEITTEAGSLIYRAIDDWVGLAPGDDDAMLQIVGGLPEWTPIGEFVSKAVGSGAAAALTTATPANIASIALADGDWDVWANIGFVLSSASMSTFSAWVSTASASDPGAPNGGAYVSETPAAAFTANQVAPIGARQITGPATVHLSAEAAFTGTGVSAYGFIGARRRR